MFQRSFVWQVVATAAALKVTPTPRAPAAVAEVNGSKQTKNKKLSLKVIAAGTEKLTSILKEQGTKIVDEIIKGTDPDAIVKSVLGNDSSAAEVEGDHGKVKAGKVKDPKTKKKEEKKKTPDTGKVTKLPSVKDDTTKEGHKKKLAAIAATGKAALEKSKRTVAAIYANAKKIREHTSGDPLVSFDPKTDAYFNFRPDKQLESEARMVRAKLEKKMGVPLTPSKKNSFDVVIMKLCGSTMADCDPMFNGGYPNDPLFPISKAALSHMKEKALRKVWTEHEQTQAGNHAFFAKSKNKHLNAAKKETEAAKQERAKEAAEKAEAEKQSKAGKAALSVKHSEAAKQHGKAAQEHEDAAKEHQAKAALEKTKEMQAKAVHDALQ